MTPLQCHLKEAGSSVLLRELANCPNIDEAFSNARYTPLLHAMSAVHGYVVMLVHVCRTGQSEIRQVSLLEWGQNNDYGKNLLKKLVQLYTALVWESTLLLALCTDDIIPADCDFGKEDMEKLIPKDSSAPRNISVNPQPSTSNFTVSSDISWNDIVINISTIDNASNNTNNHRHYQIHESNTSDMDGVPNRSNISGSRDTNTTIGAVGTSSTSSSSSNSMDIDSNDSTNSNSRTTNNTVTPGIEMMDTSDTVNTNKKETTNNVSSDQSIDQQELNSNSNRIVATPAQLKYIKSLLGASSRLGRALAELFGLLVKLCVGSPIRQRRGQNLTVNTSPASTEIARVLSYILVDGLSYRKIPPSPIPKLKLTFLICSVGFTSPMLFDDKRFAYHLMLEKFCEEGGLTAFFEMFNWALTAGHTIPIEHAIEDPTLPDGTGEFLDSWLMLLEKMVNPKSILESPHVIVNRDGVPQSSLKNLENGFNTMQYLINVQNYAFGAIMKLWGFKPLKAYGLRMSESILAIFKHILNSELIIDLDIKQRIEISNFVAQRVGLSKQSISEMLALGALRGTRLAIRTGSPPRTRESRPTTNPVPSTSSTASSSEIGTAVNNSSHDVSEDDLREITDMGFNAERGRIALMRSNGNVIQAMEYLLVHEPRPARFPPERLARLESILNELDGDIIPPVDTPPIPRQSRWTLSDGPSNYTPPLRSTRIIPLLDYDRTSNPSGIENRYSSQRIFPSVSRQNKMSNSDIPGTSKSAGSSKYKIESPILKTDLDNFCDNALEISLKLLDELPETVYRVCDLIVIILKRNGLKWSNTMLSVLLSEISECLEYLEKVITWDKNFVKDREYNPVQLISSEMANKAAVRIHLLTLLFECQYQEVRISCGLAMQKQKILPKLIGVVIEYEKLITEYGKISTTPKWVAPLFLLIDLFEKISSFTLRKYDMHKVTVGTWQWYDITAAKWNSYTRVNTNLINDAYIGGANNLRIYIGEQRYTINFNCMSQVNDETGNRRPIIMALKCLQPKSQNSTTNRSVLLKQNNTANRTVLLKQNNTTNRSLLKQNNTEKCAEKSSRTGKPNKIDKLTMNNNPMDDTSIFSSEYKDEFDDEGDVTVINRIIYGLKKDDSENLIKSCVRLMHLSIESDALHAIMRVLLRLTRTYSNAMLFAREGGINLLLNLSPSSFFVGFNTLVTLLIRHVLEDEKTLKHAFEQLLITRTLSTIPAGYKELIYMTRQMCTAISRDPIKFTDVAKQILRIDKDALKLNQLPKDERKIVKSIIPAYSSIEQHQRFITDNACAIQVINDLLAILIIPDSIGNSSKSEIGDQKTNNIRSRTSTRYLQRATFSRSSSSGSRSNSNAATSNNSNNSSNPAQSTDTTAIPDNPITENSNSAIPIPNINNSATENPTTTAGTDNHSKSTGSKTILSKASILKILSGAVRSYPAISLLITEHVYQAGASPIITENVTALSFIFDKMLDVDNLDCLTNAQNLITALASCTDVIQAQYAVVVELKLALRRALTMSECADKHLQIEILCNLIPSMIENCHDSPMMKSAIQQQQIQQNAHPRLNIFYMMVRQGLLMDLSRATQCLDLSGPITVTTLNHLLRPLELLIRMTNEQVPASMNYDGSNERTGRFFETFRPAFPSTTNLTGGSLVAGRRPTINWVRHPRVTAEGPNSTSQSLLLANSRRMLNAIMHQETPDDDDDDEDNEEEEEETVDINRASTTAGIDNPGTAVDSNGIPNIMPPLILAPGVTSIPPGNKIFFFTLFFKLNFCFSIRS